MNRELTVTPLLINHQPHPSPNSWVKLLIYEPTEAKVLSTRGKMYAVLSLSSQAEIDFTPIMQLIIESLQQRYFGVTEGGILQTLETALDAIHKQLLLAGQQDKRLSAGFSFDILVAVSWGTVLYFGQLGSSRACLLRQEKLHDIDQGDAKTSSMYLSSGVVQAGDRFLLATNQLLSKFNRKQILHHLSLPTTTLVQSLEQQIDHQVNSLESGLLLLVDIKQVPSIEEESLQIEDADTVVTPKVQSAARKLSTSSLHLATATNLGATKLWHWHIKGKVPGLPLLIIAFCLVLLGGSIAYKYIKPTTQAPVDISSAISQLQSQLNQASQVASINPDRAQDLLTQMTPILSQAQATSSDPRLATIAAQKLQLQNTLLNVQVLMPHPIGSVSALNQVKLTIFNNNLYFINTQHQLVRLSQNTLHTVATNNQLFTNSTHLIGTSSGLVAIQGQQATPLNSNGQAGPAVTISATQLTSVASYQQNAYILSSAGQLIRIADQNNTLSSPTKYFNPTISSNGLRDVAIDGNVYILRNDGTVEKYFNGQAKLFSLERASLAKNARAIFSDDTTDSLYLLGDHNLLAWSKVGQYLGQYQLSETTAWQAAAVDASTKTLYILSEGKLIEAQLPK
jgi:hypothetical protein